MVKHIKKITATVFTAVIFSTFLCAQAFAQELLVGGQAVGIRLSTAGVVVAGISEVDTAAGKVSPAGEAGIKQGDCIVMADGAEINQAADIVAAAERSGGEPVQLRLLRSGRELTVEVRPARSSEGRWALGLWLRDGVGGIGTLTFFDPETGVYGALGHSISDADTGEALPLGEGSITDAQIVSVSRGVCGKPGELNGCADFSQVLGSIELNTGCGIYGHSFVSIGGRAIQTGAISPGPATILSTVNGREVGEYEVEVNRIYKESDGVHAILSVTDEELIRRTGGIVQGMSGSPVIQDGRLVGAVTHVFVSDPTRGYAVGIDDMLKAAGIFCET